jgi:polar amino acid transport system substrate-binding protein
MRALAFVRCAALIIIAMMANPAFASEEERRLIVAADEWCPYNCTPGSAEPGYLIEVLEAVFAPLGVRVEYRTMPWKRALLSTQRGAIDAAVGAVRGNYADNIIGEQSLGLDETILIVRRGEAFTYAAPQSLDGKALGVIADYTYDNHGPLDKYLEARRSSAQDIYVIHQDKPLTSLFAMLASGRIDAFPENRYVAAYAAAQLGYAERVREVETGSADEIFVAFTPNEEGRRNLELFEAGVERLKASGRLAEILARYSIREIP